jgi:ribonuclease HI
LTRDWQIRRNPALQSAVAAVRQELRRWRCVTFHHVPGHAGVVHNERADKLAGAARRRGMPVRKSRAA